MTQPLKRRMLIVEDDDGYRDAMRRLFRHMDYEITDAASIAEALDALASLRPAPDCILLDLRLPDGPGEALLERIKAEHLPSRVIICTGDDDEGRMAWLRGLGPEVVLLKPTPLADLITACRIPSHD